MKKSEMFFAMLRKSKNVLKEYSTSDEERKFLINLKYRYAMLQPSLRNLATMVATDISRFDVEYAENVNEVLKNMHRNTRKDNIDYPRLIDTKNNNVFIISDGNIILGDVVVFSDSEEFHAFIILFNCLVLAKQREAEFIKERDIELARLNSLSDYS